MITATALALEMLHTTFLALEIGPLALAIFGIGLEVPAVDPEPAHLVGTGGAIGAICRHWVYQYASTEDVPLPTLVVNVVGSFVFGLLVFAGATESTLQLLGLGACGAFTTFSSFSVETVQIWERGDRRLAVLIAVGNLALALVGIALAWGLITQWPS